MTMRVTAPVEMTSGFMMTLLDGCAVLAIWPAGLLVALGTSPPLGASQTAVLVMAYPCVHFVLLYALGMYRRDSLLETRKTLARIPFVAALAAVFGSMCVAIMDWPLGLAPGLLAWLGHAPVIAFVCLVASGILARVLFRLLRHWGVIRRTLLVVGAGRRAWDLAWMLRAEGRNLNYRIMFAHEPVLGDVDPRLADGSEGELVCAVDAGLLRTAQALKVDQIVVAPDERRGMTLTDLLACKTAGFPVRQYLSFIETETRRIDLKRMELGWLLYSEGFYVGVLDRAAKRLLDVVISAILLVPATPVLLGAMAAIKLDDGGPIFYRQIRMTRGSRDFAILKLRTMTVNAEASGAVWAAAGDSRITRVGSFLRRTRIDELPQLLNVLGGDMSLVGPRPERPGFVAMLRKEIPLYNERHLVKAGLTGWAQINYPYGASINDARSKLSYDLYYIKNFSVMFDLLIILQTLRVLLWPGTSVR